MGFFSASFVSIPVSLVSLFWQRSFVDSNGVCLGHVRSLNLDVRRSAEDAEFNLSKSSVHFKWYT